jgi:hypothetical protein
MILSFQDKQTNLDFSAEIGFVMSGEQTAGRSPADNGLI